MEEYMSPEKIGAQHQPVRRSGCSIEPANLVCLFDDLSHDAKMLEVIELFALKVFHEARPSQH